MILAIDTSMPSLSIALIDGDDGDRTVAALSMHGEGSRNEKLLPLVDVLLAESGTVLDAVSLFAVTRGPGSFTGTRVGLATVQGLALAVDKPICAMSTHEAAAWSVGERDIVVSTDAGRGERYVSAFANGRVTRSEELMTEDGLSELMSGLTSLHLRLDEKLPVFNVAIWLARKAQWLSSASLLHEYADATPLYVRLAEAEVQLRKRE